MTKSFIDTVKEIKEQGSQFLAEQAQVDTARAYYAKFISQKGKMGRPRKDELFETLHLVATDPGRRAWADAMGMSLKLMGEDKVSDNKQVNQPIAIQINIKGQEATAHKA